ncbi:hypothetical protein RB195_006739 [Necator americanus]|uniref:Uncharacterized protein n=1 Tax=Necator americanus TaxID=51031 RepID=A0ABR1BWX9_NECAM
MDGSQRGESDDIEAVLRFPLRGKIKASDGAVPSLMLLLLLQRGGGHAYYTRELHVNSSAHVFAPQLFSVGEHSPRDIDEYFFMKMEFHTSSLISALYCSIINL